MGVNGLWNVIQPCARPTNLATLNRKRLAVDASIWIYQFLKAVRDKEGNALRNSHVVGFFRRICKLLWFGIQPIFVFDGGAPILKRQTIQGRKRRREGRREDAVRTAGKLLAVQMQRLAEEEQHKRKRDQELGVSSRIEEAEQEVIPDATKLVYADEIGMSQQERQQTRKFRKQDAYHLPELEGGIASMGRPEDPRIMSVEELEEYARQFNNGEDINLYDFSKIDFDGEFFKSLPPADRYNILNAARLRSRLRLGLSKEQLDDMFPDRMAFSRFQIERVKERNHLTQRLMLEVGFSGTDLTLSVNARVAGEKNREYILVKNEGVEGGWALGVVSKEKDVGEAHKPIDVDAIQVQFQSKEEEDDDEDVDFEDVPIEGLNRLPKPVTMVSGGQQATRHLSGDVQQCASIRKESAVDDGGEDSLFVGGNSAQIDDLFEAHDEQLHQEEEDELNKAIALSLQNQYGAKQDMEVDTDPEEAPTWNQKSAMTPKPITGTSGSMIAHIVNNRANAAVPKRSARDATAHDSDSDEDMQKVMARARKAKTAQPKPVVENKKSPFDGPLPFPKLSWGSSLFSKKSVSTTADRMEGNNQNKEHSGMEDVMGGGFEVEKQADDAPRPLPPWLVTNDEDIRDSIKKQRDADREINFEDRQAAEQERRQRQKEMRDGLIEIDSSSDDGSDVEIIQPPSPKAVESNIPAIDGTMGDAEMNDLPEMATKEKAPSEEETLASPEATVESAMMTQVIGDEEGPKSARESASASPEPEFEDVPPPEVSIAEPDEFDNAPIARSPIATEAEKALDPEADEDLFADVEYDEFSDPDDEELMAQMAEEAEEHARFASELNSKSAEQNKEDYERELRQLRNQQKKDRRDADEVTQVMITECQALLRLFGIPYITAPMEAEAQCAELVSLGLVDGIVTDDSDTFLFGGTRVYKNMFNGNKFVECYLGQDLEKELSLSREQLISLAQLLGSDYTEGLPGVGPVTAVEILSEFPGRNGLEKFRDWWSEVQSQSRSKEADASSSFRRKFRKSQATKLFLPPGFPNPAVYDAYMHPEVDNNAEPFQWGVPDLEGLRQFLMATIGWGKERTDEVLLPVIRDMNKRGVEGTQSNITRFFGGGVGVGAKEAFAPRQRAQGSRRMAAAVDRLRANVAGDGTPSTSEGDASKRKRRGKSQLTQDANDDAVQDDDEGDVMDVQAKGKGKSKRTKTSTYN